MKKNNALEWSIVKSILTLTIPILISNLLQSAYQLIDAFWVWKLWENAVAAVSISFPITFFLISVWSWFSIAWATLIAQFYWAKNFKKVNHVAAQTILLVVIVSILLSIIWYISAGFILWVMWVEAAVYNEALKFLQISFLWMVFVFSFFMFQSLLRGIWEVKLPMKIVLFTVILNLFLDPLFIFWYWIIPAMWVSWAALATLLTQSIATFIGLFFLFRWTYWIKISIPSFKPDFSYIKTAFFLWFPSSIEMSLRSLWLVILTILITSFWTTAAASYWAWSNIVQLVMILSLWLSMSTAALVWQNIGAKNIARAEEIAKVSSFLSFVFLTIIWIIVFIFAKYFVWFFVPWEQAVIDGWARFLHIISLSFWLIWIQMAITWVFRASGNMNTALILTIISQWVLQFPLAYILSKHTDLWIDWLWYAILITNIIMVFISILVFKKWDWKNKKLTKEDKLEEEVYENTVIERWYKH